MPKPPAIANRRKRIDRLVASKTGVLLDLSFGGEPQPNALVLGPHGDLRRDPRALPFPLPDGCVHTAVVTHVIDFLDPGEFFVWFDELHRIVRPGGIVYLSGPYGGDESVGWLSDPQHRVRIVEGTFAWLDARTPVYALHSTVGRPQPKPWSVLQFYRVPGTLGTVSYNVTLRRSQ